MKASSIIHTKIKENIKSLLFDLLKCSLQKAAKEQQFTPLIDQLQGTVPDIASQYTNCALDSEFLCVKVRNQHAFQISLVDQIIGQYAAPMVVDIGDSSGTHLQYLLRIYDSKKISTLSVNLDPMAIKKIRTKGLKAVQARAEDLSPYNVAADIILCFQTLEHLPNPSYFLHEISSKTEVNYLIITVPYLKNSRVGLKHIRTNNPQPVNAENTHIFELKPEDWRLLARHSGWKIVHEQIYFQYPLKSILRLTQFIWRIKDFEGFYGMILTPDGSWADRYLDW